MCGITGQFLVHSEIDPQRLSQSASTLVHRGPDDQGIYHAGRFGMAHTRLAIIDLEGGHQPLTTDDWVLIANGEIYNYIELRQDLIKLGHRFITYSDSEVILHAYRQWGRDCLNYLRGMFAFALWDGACQGLLLGRDRLGIKPLFLHQDRRGVTFASEIKAILPLLEQQPAINPAGIAQYLQHQFSTGPATPFQGIERIAPGEALWLEGGRIQARWFYWQPWHIETQPMGYTEAERHFDALMATVMDQHMRTDVPFGLFLSGGVDSAILLALLSRATETPIRTFSVGFAEADFTDELPLATAFADQFNTRHRAIRPTQQAIVHSLPLSIWAADDLMRDFASLPTLLLAQAASEELKVVFAGEGGDEVFGGYGRYRTSPFERRLKALLNPGTGGFRARGNLRGGWPGRLLRDELLAIDAIAPFKQLWRQAPRFGSELQRMQLTDLRAALPDNLLVKLDRMLMSHAVEGRVPFLDHEVVEFGLRLPDRLKIRDGQGKDFLKRWGSRLLPEDRLYAKKRGFHVPLNEWLQGAFLDILGKQLPRHPAIREWFHPAGVTALLKACTKPNHAAKRNTWALLQFALWYDLFVRGEGERPAAQEDPLIRLARGVERQA